MDFPRTHDLERLVALLPPESRLRAAELELAALSGWSVAARYPGNLVVHHKVLDRGALGVDADRRLMVAQAFHGTGAAQRWLIGFAGELLGEPQPGTDLAEAHRAWHERQVFRGPPRAEPWALVAEPPAGYHR